MTGREAAVAALEARLKLYTRPAEPVHGQVGWGATVPEIVDVVLEAAARSDAATVAHVRRNALLQAAEHLRSTRHEAWHGGERRPSGWAAAAAEVEWLAGQ